MDTPWGPLPVSDAHVHFFSHRFFDSLARQRQIPMESLESILSWRIPPEDPAQLASEWNAELDRHGLDRCAIIASIPDDYDSVTTAVAAFPQRFYGYAMVNPLSDDTPKRVQEALETGRLHGLCFFPAMHRYSVHDERVSALLDLAATHHAVAFVHCGVLSVGVRKKLGLPSLFDMRYSNPIDLHAVALRYPQVRFVVPHFGAGYFRESLMLCDLCPNVYLDTSSSNSWIEYEPHLDLRTVLRRAIDVLGPHRLVFGTDSSFFPRGWHAAVFEAQAKALYEIGADQASARLIFHDNLHQFFPEKKSPAE
jgi:predicted TIM-barrel fold metal-dependent hydrolase